LFRLRFMCLPFFFFSLSSLLLVFFFFYFEVSIPTSIGLAVFILLSVENCC